MAVVLVKYAPTNSELMYFDMPRRLTVAAGRNKRARQTRFYFLNVNFFVYSSRQYLLSKVSFQENKITLLNRLVNLHISASRKQIWETMFM